MFYKISLKWTRVHDEWITFWRKDNSGYCWFLEWAGEYEEEPNDSDTILVPVMKIADIGEIAHYEGKKVCVVKNSIENRRILGIKKSQLKK